MPLQINWFALAFLKAKRLQINWLSKRSFLGPQKYSLLIKFNAHSLLLYLIFTNDIFLDSGQVTIVQNYKQKIIQIVKKHLYVPILVFGS